MTQKKRPVIGILEDDVRLAKYLEQMVLRGGFETAFVANSLAAAAEALQHHTVDLCLIDLQLPDGNGADLIKRLADKGVACLVLTVFGDEENVLRALAAGANGYLLKDERPEGIAGHITATLNGDAPFSPSAARYLLSAFRTRALKMPAPGPGDISLLTPKELDVLTLFSKGLSYQEAASALQITRNTVAEHVKSIYRKLDVHSKNEAVFEASQLGLL